MRWFQSEQEEPASPLAEIQTQLTKDELIEACQELIDYNAAIKDEYGNVIDLY